MTTEKTIYQIQQETRRQAFASALNHRMHMVGLDQAMLAEKSGIKSDMISRYCNGFALPRPRTQEAIAQALGCKRSDLFNTSSIPSRHTGEYFAFRSGSDGNVTLELRKCISLGQASQIIQILGTPELMA